MTVEGSIRRSRMALLMQGEMGEVPSLVMVLLVEYVQ